MLIDILYEVFLALPEAVIVSITVTITIIPIIFSFEYVVDRTFLKKNPKMKNVLQILLFIVGFTICTNYTIPIIYSLINKIFL